MYWASSSPALAGEVNGLTLLPCEGKAVGALIHSGIALMGAHLDLVQGAVVLQIAVMSTLADSTFDGLVCIAVHSFNLPLWSARLV